MDMDESFPLLDLPIEVFSIVIQKCPTASLLKLSATGSAHITKLLASPWVVLDLTLKKREATDEKALIPILKRFPSLQSFSLYVPEPKHGSSPDIGSILLELPHTLTSLRLSFPGVEQSISTVAHCLSDLTPSLATLYIWGGLSVLNDDFWLQASFPKTLSTLSLGNNTPISFETLVALPSHITSLSLSKPPLYVPERTERYSSSLKSLHFHELSHLDPASLSNLPTQLESYEALFLGHVPEEAMLTLPTTLTSLKLPYVTFQSLKPLGRLTQLNTLHLGSFLPDYSMSDLPRSLTSIILQNSPPYTDSVWIDLPPLLRYYEVPIPRKSKYRYSRPSEPRSWDSTLLRFLPKSLLQIDTTRFGEATEADLMHLPPSLTDLTIDTASLTLLSNISPRLTRLHIMRFTMDSETIRALPRSLNRLTIADLAGTDESSLIQLPQYLTSLEIGMDGGKLMLSSAVAQYLPLHLIKLQIIGQCELDDSFFPLLKLKYLEQLNIVKNNMCHFTEDISPHLPKTLRSIVLEGMKPWSDHGAFKSLPHRLETLHFEWKPKPSASSFIDPKILKELLPSSLHKHTFSAIPANSVLSFFGLSTKSANNTAPKD